MSIDAVIWDWNGTLLDDAHISYDILNLLLRTHGYAEIESLEKYKSIFGFPIQSYYSRAGIDFNMHSYGALAQIYTDEYAKRVLNCRLHNNAAEVLAAVKDKGIKQIILSASKQSVLCEQAEYFGVSHFFDELVGISDIYAKGKLEAGLCWKERNNIKNAVMIGDTLHDFEVAKALLVTPLLVCSGHNTKEALQSTGASIAESLNEALKIIEKM